MAHLVLTPLTSCSFLFASCFALTNVVSDRCISEGVTLDLQQGRLLGREDHLICGLINDCMSNEKAKLFRIFLNHCKKKLISFV